MGALGSVQDYVDPQGKKGTVKLKVDLEEVGRVEPVQMRGGKLFEHPSLGKSVSLPGRDAHLLTLDQEVILSPLHRGGHWGSAIMRGYHFHSISSETLSKGLLGHH